MDRPSEVSVDNANATMPAAILLEKEGMSTKVGLKIDFQRTEEVVIILTTSPHLPYPILCKKVPMMRNLLSGRVKEEFLGKG